VFLPVLGLLALSALPNASVDDPLDEGYRDMYNLRFDQAHRIFQQWERSHPDDPIGPVSDAAAYLFFEFDRLKILRADFFTEDHNFFNRKVLKPDPKVKQAFDADLARAKHLADGTLQRHPENETALLATVLRLALHADYEALIEKQYWQSLNEIKQARNEAEVLLAKYPDCYDANLAVGVENYLLSQKAAPVRWFLHLAGAQTDKQTGIEKLRLVAEKGHYLKPYAKVLLAIAALRDNNKGEARQLISELARQFPENDLFRQELEKLAAT
jgi:hypothetical protein